MTQERTSPFRQRMMEDMRIRGMGHKSQKAHIRALKDFAAFLGRSPDTATQDDLRAYQLHMADAGVTPSTFKARISQGAKLPDAIAARVSALERASQLDTGRLALRRGQRRRRFNEAVVGQYRTEPKIEEIEEVEEIVAPLADIPLLFIKCAGATLQVTARRPPAAG